MIKRERQLIKIWSMRIACWTTKATNTHPEYIILLAFPWPQWLRERPPMLRLYVHCHSCYLLFLFIQLHEENSGGYESLFFTKSFKTQQSASCACELPEYHFYRKLARPAFVTCASRVVVTPVWIINVSEENAASGSIGGRSS